MNLDDNEGESEEKDPTEYIQADLFLSYFEKNLNRKDIYYKIDQVNQFSLHNAKDNKEESSNLIAVNKPKNLKEQNKINTNNLYNKFNDSKFSSQNNKFNKSPPQVSYNLENLAIEKSRFTKDHLNIASYRNNIIKSNQAPNNNIIQKNSNNQISNDKVLNHPNQEKKEISNPLKIEVKRNYSTNKEDSASTDKNASSTKNKKNYVSNNILYESVSNTSNIHNDSFFRTENFSKTILETEINEINYVLTETNEHKKEKRIYSKQNKSKNNRNKGSNFIQKVREALNFSNTIRNTHLISNKNNNNNNNNHNLNDNKEIIKNAEASFYNPNNINNISIYSKKENQGSGNTSKRLVNLPYLDSNTIVKDNSPIANMINEYFDKLESKQINNKNAIAGKDLNQNMSNIINIGCANFISNNINNNFTNEKTHKCSEDVNSLNRKEIQNKNSQDILFNNNNNNVSLSMDKINENLRNAENQSELKSPEFGLNHNKGRSIIKVTKPEEELENKSNNAVSKSFNAKNLNKTLAAMQSDKMFKDDNGEKNLKQKLKLNLNKINNVSFNLQMNIGINSSRNKTLSYDTDKMDFYLSQKILKKRNYNRESKLNENNFCANSNYLKTDNNLIDCYMRKQAELKKNHMEIYKNTEVNYFTARSKTSKNISLNTVVIIDKIDSNKNVNETAENIKADNQHEIHQAEITEKDLNSQNLISQEQQGFTKHLDSNKSALNKNEDFEKEKNSNLILRASSNEIENLVNRNNSKPVNQVEHRKNFSFGTSYFDKNIVKNNAAQNKKAESIQNNYQKLNNNFNAKTNSITTSNIPNKQESFNSNFKNSSSITNNLNNNTVSNKKINSSSLSNKKTNTSESLIKKVPASKKQSLEIKTDLIDSIKEIDSNKIAAESTRNSISFKDTKLEFKSFNKINTTKNISKNKIELYTNANKEENINELKFSIKNNASKHTKTYSTDFLSTVNKNCEVKEKNESKIINKINEAPNENEIKKASKSLDKNKLVNKNANREFSEIIKLNLNNADLDNKDAEETISNAKKLTKNLSVINEKENSEKKPNVNNSFINANNKHSKKNEKVNRKNYSVDLDNLNTSIEKDNNEAKNKKAIQSHLRFNTKNKQTEKKEAKEKEKDFTEKNKLINENSKSKDNVDVSNKHSQMNKKDNLNDKKLKHRVSKSVIIENNKITEKDSKKDITALAEEKEDEGKTENERTLINKSENLYSNLIRNNNLIVNEQNEIKNEEKSLKGNKIENNAAEQSKRRSISNEKRTSIKRNSKLDNNNDAALYSTNGNLNESDTKNKRKNAFRNSSVLNEANEKDKKTITDDAENKSTNNPPKRNILKNKLKKSSLVEAENDNAKKRMSNNNKSKEELKSEKDKNKTKKSLKDEEKGRVSTSKVRKVIRPSNLKDKNVEENKENDSNLNLEANENTEQNINTNEVESSNKSKEDLLLEQKKEQESKIDPIQFDNLLKNIKIDDSAIYKQKDNEKETQEEVNFQSNSAEKKQLNPKEEANSNLNNQESNLEQIEEKTDESKAGTNQINQNHITFNRKITFDVSDGICNENTIDDLANTPKFSRLINNRNVSENKLNTIEEPILANNLEQQFNGEVKPESKKQSSTAIGDYMSEKKKLKKGFLDKKAEVLYLVFNSNYLCLEKKIFLFHNLKPLRNSMTEEEKKDFKISCLKEKIKLNEKILSKYINEPEYSALIMEPLKPSKTAKNGLSLFSKDEENNLVNKEQPKEISNFFKFVALLFNKEIKEEDIIEQNYIKTFFKTIIPENMTLKTFFIEISNNIYLINDKNFDLIHSFIKEAPQVIKSTDLLRKNRTCSYMSFLVKEIYDYYSAKATDGFYIYKLRNLQHQTLKLKESLNKEVNKLESFKNIQIEE